MIKQETRTDLVAASNRRGGKDKIHRTECIYAGSNTRPLPVHVGSVGSMSHRLYETCGHCLKGLSTFRLPEQQS